MRYQPLRSEGMRRGLVLLTLLLLAACSASTKEPGTGRPAASPEAGRPGNHTLTVTVGDKDPAAKLGATDVLWAFFTAHPRRR